MRPRLVSSCAVFLMLLAPAAASASFAHVIAPGESLSSIAAVDGLSVQQLAAANGLSPNAEVVAGATIQIPPQTAASSQSPGPVDAGAAGTSSNSYVVRPGDTLSGIAASTGTSVGQLAAANGLDPAGVLLAGSVLTIPGAQVSQPSAGSAGVQGSEQSAGSAGVQVSQPSATSTGAPPFPTDERLSGSQIAQIAAANGAPASLTEAIAWQESGFNNDLVSNADARGVMQIIPSTWSWIEQNLAPQPPLAPASALDNVRAGALLLHSLLAATGDPTLAVAAYYQGLGSVQRFGVEPDTQPYVDDVMALAQRFGGG